MIQTIQPAKNDRATFYGQTGSGKTTLVRYLLALRSDVPVYVYDFKGLIKWSGFKRVTTIRKFIDSQRERKLIYAPNIYELASKKHQEAFFNYCYQRKNCQVYIDEVSAIARDDESIPFWYQSCITRGRERGISVFSSTQRPMNIPQIVLSESEHHYCFALQMPQDRIKVYRVTGIPEEKIAALISKEHRFYYANAEGEIKGSLRLKIKRG